MRRSNASRGSKGVQASFAENSRWEPELSRIVHATPDGATAVYAGEIRARYDSDLALRIAGKVVPRNVEVGSVVRKGQLLARLDPKTCNAKAIVRALNLPSRTLVASKPPVAAGAPLFIAVVLTAPMIQLKSFQRVVIWANDGRRDG